MTVNPEHEQNRKSWNAITPVHNSHKRDQAGFLRAGGSTLFPDELELLGDISGNQLVHLQCNCGQDSLSLAGLGAQVTGVDISDAAIEFARTLSEDSGIPATFVRDDLFSWFDDTDADRFDVAYSTYGTVGWLTDLSRWARGVAKVLRPGGRLVLLEFHPLIWSLGPNPDSYFAAGRLDEPGGVNDYVDEALAPSGYLSGEEGFSNPEPAHGYQWTVASMVQAVVDAGLHIRTMREYPYTNGCKVFEGMQRIDGNRYTVPEGDPAMPLMLGLVAQR